MQGLWVAFFVCPVAFFGPTFLLHGRWLATRRSTASILHRPRHSIKTVDHNYNVIHAETAAATAPTEMMVAVIKHVAANFR